MWISDDTRAWAARRAQAVALRIANGPKLKVPDGFHLVSDESLQQLAAELEDDVDDEPIDPAEMKRANLAYAMSMNDDVEPLVEHVRSIRKNLMAGPDGFTEEAAEHMCMGVWHGILGGMIEDE